MMKVINVNNTYTAPTWQKELANAIKNPLQLLKLLDLTPDMFPLSASARKNFPLLVPLPFIAKMKKGDINDPLLKQILPITEEDKQVLGYSLDPLQEHDNSIQGVLHKYKSRILLVLKSGCAVNCRYCFRRHFPYNENNLNKKQFAEILLYIKAHPDVNEVILSGGDPLMSNDDFLHYIISELENLKQLKRLRIHTRLPVVIPQRITDTLCKILQNTRLQVIVVLHINHPNEIDLHLKTALKKLHKAGIQLLNQSVLLRGINDNCAALVALSEALFDAHVLPYYIFLLDKVQGAHHFDVSENKAKQLILEISGELPGYLVPRLSREIAGEKSKTLINPL